MLTKIPKMLWNVCAGVKKKSEFIILEKAELGKGREGRACETINTASVRTPTHSTPQ